MKNNNKRKKQERRGGTIVCSNCGREMMCMNRFQSIYELIRGLYVWYVCPRRKGEKGCGHTVVLKISPKTKRPQTKVGRIKNVGMKKKISAR